MTLHELLDENYGLNGSDLLKQMLEGGSDPNELGGPNAETALHVAARRRRVEAVEILIQRGAHVNTRNGFGKTAYAHAARRLFDDVADVLLRAGADTSLNEADQFAIAVSTGHLDSAREILAGHPDVIRTGNPEEDRVLADVSGRNDPVPVDFLIRSGADLLARGLDYGTPLHQAAWFGQLRNAEMLVEAGAMLDDFDIKHNSSPIGWAAHGSRYSGGADERQAAYVGIVRLLLDAGSSLFYPGREDQTDYLDRLIRDASPEVAEILKRAKPR